MSKVAVENLNPKLLEARYAVRGAILIEANRLNQELKGEDHGLPFDAITYCNIGNPQRLMQTPLTFVRNVLSLCTSPQLLRSEHAAQVFSADEIARAQSIVDRTPGILGAYTHSQGLDFIRQEVSDFITARDEIAGPTIDRIFLTDGASPGIQNVMFALIRDETDGIMIPIPQYPLYSASIALFGGARVGYYLDESTEWSVSEDELERSYAEATSNGVNVRSIVVINPGNPTGQVLSVEDMQTVIRFCQRHSLVLLADEVYQENIYVEGLNWVSFRKVIHDMNLTNDVELVSFHSVSKGFFGECGRRGGYMEFSEAFDPAVIAQMYKKASINLCPNVDGQITVSIMVNPPPVGSDSRTQFDGERDAIIASLARRSVRLVQMLDSLPNVTCNRTSGAMYAFPNVVIPERAVAAAREAEMEPDAFYCLELLKATGICVVPGSGFCQREGTYHFRTTFLPPEDVMDEVIGRFADFHRAFIAEWQ